jgi:hypothetical protein
VGGDQVGEFVPHDTSSTEAQDALCLMGEAQINTSHKAPADETRGRSCYTGETISERQELNRLLLDLIAEEVRRYPDMRFLQILLAMKIVDGEDRFYEEPWDTINRFHGAVRR